VSRGRVRFRLSKALIVATASFSPFRKARPRSLVCPKATSALSKIAMFRDWLQAEAAADLRRLKAGCPQ